MDREHFSTVADIVSVFIAQDSLGKGSRQCHVIARLSFEFSPNCALAAPARAPPNFVFCCRP